MGKPEITEGFEAFAVNDIMFYVAKDILEDELKDNLFNFYIEGYGRYTFKVIE